MRLSLITLSLVAAISFAACSKSDNAKPATTAPISGSVLLYDEGLTSAANNGMTVTVEGTTLKATTGTDGKFRIENVPFGAVNLVFEKSGYGTFKVFNIQHQSNNGTGTTLTTTYSLGKTSTTTSNTITTLLSNGQWTISPYLNPAATNSAPRYVRIFFSTSPSVSYTNYQKYSDAYTVKNDPASIVLTKEYLTGLGFASGTQVYLNVFGDSYWSNKYTDPTLGRDVFPNINPVSAGRVFITVP